MARRPDPGGGCDHYAVLGVRPTASAAEITSAYRRLVRAFHPDVSPDRSESDDRFAAASAAYETLRDPVLRAAYDAQRAGRDPATRPARAVPVRVGEARPSRATDMTVRPLTSGGAAFLRAGPTRMGPSADESCDSRPPLLRGWVLVWKWTAGQ
ncbi:J domain-containing protein [Streptomyces sp. AK02-01A]|uniref:J domain-containing protein n=1 Tax=Streptomyces sp. AK02-01A TaxID=3028648 RepID=UPI0029B2E587|nr:J domain-containing protein [Streptomyces sp. AK02-01A]MDX3852739.1 J domain-containing protein [Streptomyces sp. AK02-01A]